MGIRRLVARPPTGQGASRPVGVRLPTPRTPRVSVKLGAMLLYNSPISGNCYKVRLLLAHLGVPYKTEFVDAVDRTQKRDELAGLSPTRRVPTIVLDDGRPLAESNAILTYFGEGTRFVPEEPYDRAQMFQWMFWEQYEHEPAIAVARFLKTYSGHPEWYEAQREQLHKRGVKALEAMERHLETRNGSPATRCRSRTSSSTRTRTRPTRAASISRRTPRSVPGSAGSPPSQATCRSTPDVAGASTLRDLVNGYRVSQAIHVAVVLGIPTCSRTGRAPSRSWPRRPAPMPTRSTASCERSRASACSRSRRAALRADPSWGGCCAATRRARSPAGRRSSAGPASGGAGASLLHSVRTGENAFRHAHGDVVWSAAPATRTSSAVFDGAMAATHAASTGRVLDGVRLRPLRHDRRRRRRQRHAAGRDPRARTRVRGHPVRPAARRRPAGRAARAASPTAARSSAGASSSRSRRAATPTSSRRSSTTGRTRRRSRSCASAARRWGRTRRCCSSSATSAQPNEASEAKFSDLNMLVNPGGRERTRAEYERLFDQSGLRLIEWVPAGDARRDRRAAGLA